MSACLDKESNAMNSGTTAMSAPVMFDRKLQRRNLARRDEALCRFAAEQAAAEVNDRLSLVKRSFTRPLIAGPLARWLAPLLPFADAIVEDRDLALDEEAFPFAPESLDCIISIFALQGVNDLPGALLQMRRALKPDGLLLAALFAGETLKELRQAWLSAESAHTGGATLRVAPMVDLREMGGLLQRAGFALPVMDMDRTEARYDGGLALMREVKALGFANTLMERSRTPVTRSLLMGAALAYGEGRRVPATLEVAWVTAWSPHGSQQKPLKPGSARTRLADALKVPEVKL
jgi:SAM-dependent methyltransferase